MEEARNLLKNRRDPCDALASVSVTHNKFWGSRMGDSSKEQRRRLAIRALLEDLPSEYADRHADLTAISHIFHEELARSLQPGLAEDAQRLQTMNFNQRRKWVSDHNEDLRKLHLAFSCPRTKRPAILVVDAKDSEHEHLRYRFQIYDSGRAVKTFTSTSLPAIDIMEDDARIESFAHISRGGGR
jgi:hypothetical protein